MAKLDLAGGNVETLDLHADFTMSDDRWNALLGGYAERFREHDLPVVFADQYRRRNKQHGVFAFIHPSESSGSYHLNVIYRLDPDIPGPKHLWRVQRMFDLFGSEIDPLEFSVRAAFSYPSDRFSSRLRLPVTLGPSEDASFDEIRGMRVMKYADGGRVRYNVVVDYLPESESVYHHVTFSYVGTIDSATMEAALVSAREISERFIDSERG